MSATLTTVHLVGSLGRAVEREEWTLDVKSPGEAIHAINVLTRGALERYLAGPARARLYRIALGKRDNVIDAKEGGNRSGRTTIYIMPTIRGRNSGIGKVLAGIALIGLAIINPAFLPFALQTAAGGLTLAGSIVVGFGISLVLGGISQILTPKPEGPTTQPEQAQSTSFPGNAGSVVQGGCVPVVYGHALVSPIPVSVTITNNDVSTSAAGTPGSVIVTPIDGGGTQYGPGNPDDPFQNIP